MALSLRRANAVKDALVRNGVPAQAISVIGRGEQGLLVQTGDGVREPRRPLAQARERRTAEPVPHAGLDVVDASVGAADELGHRRRREPQPLAQRHLQLRERGGRVLGPHVRGHRPERAADGRVGGEQAPEQAPRTHSPIVPHVEMAISTHSRRARRSLPSGAGHQ